MWWRLARSQFVAQKGEKNKSAFKKIVRANEKPGVLAYLDGVPIGWCAVAPRQAYTFLDRSRVLKRIADHPVWSISCLFVARPFRRSGVSVQLINAAVAHARTCGAKIVEGYPVEPRKTSMPDAFAWTGLASAFGRAGFKEVARRSFTRPIMRFTINARS